MARLAQIFSKVSSLTLGAFVILFVVAIWDCAPLKIITSRSNRRSLVTDRLREGPVAIADSEFLATSGNVSRIARRDDFSCDKSRPCSNGACCGVSGFCGYGEYHHYSTLYSGENEY
jgi:hypothetical protein